MFRVGGKVDEKVINENNYTGEAVDDSFHQPLETGWAAQQSHGTGDLLELAHTRHSEGCVGPGPGMENHLPKTGTEVNSTENSTARTADFTDTLT